MKTTYDLVQVQAGELGELLDNPIKPELSIEDVITMIERLTFICETVAHLQGQEAILKTTEKAVKMVEKLKGES